MNKALLIGRACADYLPLLQAAISTEWEFDTWLLGADEQALAASLAKARAVLTGTDAVTASGFNLERYALQRYPNLELLQLPFSGYEWLTPAMLPEGCTACNIQAHGITIAEYVLATLLEWEIGLARIDAEFRAGSWRSSGAMFGEPHGEVYGKTLGLIGLGAIGAEVAKRADAFGMRVIAVARTQRPAPPPLAWLGDLSRLDALLQESDYVLVACDLNDGTRDLINAERLARMKRGGFLINVTRGGVVNEAALFAALQTKQIAGAAIDVWYQYPEAGGEPVRPSSLPYHTLDNLIMTPHCSSFSRGHHERRWKMVAANLDRLARGEPLQNVVMRKASS